MPRAARRDDDTVTIPRAEYEALVAAAEDAVDRAAIARGDAGFTTYVPLEVVDRILAGENKLRVFRKFRGMTLDALGAEIGVGKSYLSQIETGKRDGTARVLANCARVLGVTVDDLI